MSMANQHLESETLPPQEQKRGEGVAVSRTVEEIVSAARATTCW